MSEQRHRRSRLWEARNERSWVRMWWAAVLGGTVAWGGLGPAVALGQDEAEQQQQERAAKTPTRAGTVTKIEEGQLTVKLETGETKTFQVDADTQIQIDGQQADLETLRVGQRVRITARGEDQNEAVRITALKPETPRPERTQPERPATERPRSERQPGTRDQATQPARGRTGGLGVGLSERRDGEQARITTVVPGSPAEKAGLRSGDVLVSVDGTEVKSADDVIREIGRKQPGDQVEIVVLRDGQEQTLTATLTSREQALERRPTDAEQPGRTPGRPPATAQGRDREQPGRAETRNGQRIGEAGRRGQFRQPAWIGVMLREGREGLEIVQLHPAGPAREAGLRQRDTIRSIDGAQIESMRDLLTVLRELQPDDEVEVRVLRNGREQAFTVIAADPELAMRDDQRSAGFRGLAGDAESDLGARVEELEQRLENALDEIEHLRERMRRLHGEDEKRNGDRGSQDE